MYIYIYLYIILYRTPFDFQIKLAYNCMVEFTVQRKLRSGGDKWLRVQTFEQGHSPARYLRRMNNC